MTSSKAVPKAPAFHHGNSPSSTPKSKERPRQRPAKKHQNKRTGTTTATTTTTNAAKEPNHDASTDDHGRLATRVCIKNLPANTTAEQLKTFLTSSSKRPLNSAVSSLVFTDCRILHHSKKTTPSSSSSSNNKSSRSSKATTTATTLAPMAFCGFASPDMAQHVIRTFHKTYMGTHRLLVEAAVKKDSVAITSSSSSSSLVAANEKGNATTKRRTNEAVGDKKHSKAAAAAAAMQLQQKKKPRSKPKIWENDDDDDFEIPSKPVVDDSSSHEDDDEDEEEEEDMNVDEKDEDDDSEDEDDAKQEQQQPPAVEGKETINDAVSDLDFLKSKQKQVEDLEDDHDDEQQEEELETKAKVQPKNHGNDDDSDDSDDSNAEEAMELEKAVDHSDGNDAKDNLLTESTNRASDDQHINEVDGAKEEDPHRLFVRNLPFTASEKDLRSLFQEFGTITECYLPMADDNDDEEHHPSSVKGSKSTDTNQTPSRHNKGFAFVSFDTNTSATTARNQLDGSDFQGRLLHILPARKVPSSQQNEKELDGVDPKHLTYKQRQALERRQQEAAATNSNSWSTSFVRGDAVIDSLAEQLGLRKADIVNAKQDGITAGDAAVRLALGETHVIEENRNYFRSFGVDMDALVLAKAQSENTDSNTNSSDNHGIVRSKTSILVKNLPFSTTLEELTKMFHGAVSTAADEAPKKILLPPSRTIALVQYANAANAKRAFRRLAYKRFQHVPLYLEWAPLAALGEAPSADTANTTSIQESGSQTSSLPLTRGKELDAAEAVDDDDVVPGVSHTIYVKNLNFSTEESALRQVFSKHGTVRAVKIPQKIAPIQKKGSTAESDVRTLSMGYGFVELASSDEVRKAIQQLQGTLLDGHAIELKPSNKEIAPKQQKSKLSLSNNTKNRTKLMVRNVAFQASRKELLQLFGSFGQLRKVRLPKKFDGTHRGFAFCEYLTHKEAEAAMQSLSQTHLYGRHLVLEWASEEDDVDVLEGLGNNEQSMTKLRDKAQRDVALEPTKKRRRVG